MREAVRADALADAILRARRYVIWTVCDILFSPLSALILHLSRDSALMRPWQWLLILEPVPALVIAALVAAFLPSSPLRCASFLTAEEHAWLLRETSAFQEQRAQVSANLHRQRSIRTQLARLLGDYRVLVCAFGGFCAGAQMYGVGLFKAVALEEGDHGVAQIALFDTVPKVRLPSSRRAGPDEGAD